MNENNHDNLIIKVFFKDNHLVKYNKFIHNKKYINIRQYLINRFIDFTNFNESLYRILRHIEILPKCKCCGKPVKFKQQNYNIYCSCKCANNDIDKILKDKNTKFQKYGHYNFNNRELCQQTKLIRYNDKNYNNVNQIKETKLIRYNNSTYVNPNKAKETCLLKYGYKSSLDLPKCRQNRKSQKSLEKEYQTKKINNTFNSSIPENKSYELLKEKYSDIKYQYRSQLYPFNCDFYIPSLNLYIECNYHWTHGGKPFEGTKEDLEKLNKWKNKNSKYYTNAIYTWTDLDVRKRNIATKNNINYIEFWNINELQNWIKNKE